VGLVILHLHCAVAGVSQYLLGLPLAVGFVLGAMCRRPTTVAPDGHCGRFALPTMGVLTILEGDRLGERRHRAALSFANQAVVHGRLAFRPRGRRENFS
jgi:hypothetical protein